MISTASAMANRDSDNKIFPHLQHSTSIFHQKCKHKRKHDFEVPAIDPEPSRKRPQIMDTLSSNDSYVIGHPARKDMHGKLAPPDFQYVGSFEEAIQASLRRMRWLLFHLQDKADVRVHQMNAVFKDDQITQIITENFVLYQCDNITKDGLLYANRYKEPTQYPHICVIDPLTRQCIWVWDSSCFKLAGLDDFKRSIASIRQALTELLRSYGTFEQMMRKNGSLKISAPRQSLAFTPSTCVTTSVFTLSDNSMIDENVMLKRAIKESMETTVAASSSYLQAEAIDGDGKPEVHSASSSNKYENCKITCNLIDSPSNLFPEPADDMPNLTRLQLRLPNGRIQRRFCKNDSTSKLYAFVRSLLRKKECEISHFTLVTVQPRRIEHLESKSVTLADSGLLNAVVIVEYVE